MKVNLQPIVPKKMISFAGRKQKVKNACVQTNGKIKLIQQENQV